MVLGITAAGSVTDAVLYDAFGNTISRTGSTKEVIRFQWSVISTESGIAATKGMPPYCVKVHSLLCFMCLWHGQFRGNVFPLCGDELLSSPWFWFGVTLLLGGQRCHPRVWDFELTRTLYTAGLRRYSNTISRSGSTLTPLLYTARQATSPTAPQGCSCLAIATTTWV